MKTTLITKNIFIFLTAFTCFAKMNAQICTSPVTLTVNTGFTAIDSTNLALTYYKFTATNTQHAIKFWIKGLNTGVQKGFIKTYTNNCGSLSTSGVSCYRRLNSDTLYVDMPSVSIGVQYLIELKNMGSTYLVNKISIGNNLLTGITTSTLSCPSASVPCQPSLPCDLVCNGDFECLQYAPTGSSQIAFNGVWNWNDPAVLGNSSSDLLSATAAFTTGASVPCNAFGYQNAYSNNNYAGMIAYYNGDIYTECIQTQLTAPMISGKKYEISFYASQAEFSTVGINALAAYLTTSELVLTTAVAFTITPAAVETNTTLLNDQNNWQKITMSYTASGGEAFLTLGRPAGSGYLNITPSTFTCGFTNGFTPAECYMFIDKVSVIPVFDVTISASPSTTVCGAGTSLSATGNYTNITYNWMPGSLTGSNVPINPTSATVYTLTGNYMGCTKTQTLAITVNSACCTSTVPSLTSYSITGVAINGPRVINQDLVIYGTNTVTAFTNGEFLIAPNVKITVIGNGNELKLIGAHLYACSTTMWKGIEVADGSRFISEGSVSTGNSTLIEDAVTAVNMNTVSAIAQNVPLEITNTIFNKNYVAINIGNVSTSTVNMQIIKNVFTSRNFTFTPTSWPTALETTPGLRYAGTSTTGLTSPYALQNATVISLKSPYTNQSARTGIQLSNAGYTSGSNYYGIAIGNASLTGAADFNLFDALQFGIDAINSNVESFNNVFQNSQRVYLCSKSCTYMGGTGIKSLVNTNLNARLNLTATGSYSTSYSVGNRFWDCHKAVEATNVYRVDCNYATFRSTQIAAAATNTLLLPGEYGIVNTTNRFENNIRYNKFNNINNVIAIIVSPATYTYGASTYNGILANDILIDHNYFGAQLTSTTVLGSAFLNNAVNLSSTSSAGWNSIGGIGLRIANNEIDRAWRGAYVSTFGYPVSIQSNTVNLLNDATLALTQQGISVGNNLYGLTTIANNKLTGTNTTNTLVTLIYVGASPVSGVTCNTLSTAYQGFEFNNNSSGSTWKGNDMTSHARGMVLSNNGIIGTQGGAGAPSDNKWNGSWTGGNNGTYIDGASDAANSKLWVKNSGIWVPPNPGFLSGFSAFSYQVAANTPTTTGTYSCGTPAPPQFMMMLPPSSSPNMQSLLSSNVSAEELYIGDNTSYRFLDANPTVKNSNINYVNFYNAKANTSIDKFKQVEANLHNGQIAQAQSINNAISVVNEVEGNYKSYYTLYAKYKNGNFTSADSSNLINLAKLCPGISGSIVYQARALYNFIYKTVKVYKEECTTALSYGSRLTSTVSGKETIKTNWDVELFPNPTRGNFTLVGKLESETLTVTITDIAGKLIYNTTVNTSNFIVNLDVNTKAGVYLINIKNSTSESITKKLVVAD